MLLLLLVIEVIFLCFYAFKREGQLGALKVSARAGARCREGGGGFVDYVVANIWTALALGQVGAQLLELLNVECSNKLNFLIS